MADNTREYDYTGWAVVLAALLAFGFYCCVSEQLREPPEDDPDGLECVPLDYGPVEPRPEPSTDVFR